MPVTNAAEATEVVKSFCEKMNPGLPFFPQGATLGATGNWQVKVLWGFIPLVFEVSYSGEIAKYYREQA